MDHPCELCDRMMSKSPVDAHSANLELQIIDADCFEEVNREFAANIDLAVAEQFPGPCGIQGQQANQRRQPDRPGDFDIQGVVGKKCRRDLQDHRIGDAGAV